MRLPPDGAVVDDERVTNRISMLISAFGVLVGALLLVAGVREYQSGASVLWPALAVLLFLTAVHALVRDLRSPRK